MRFSDIKRFPRCCYRVDVSWQLLERHIARDVEDVGLDLNPDFQRAHVWTPDQQIKYVEYVLRGGTSGKELYFNCKGWMHGFSGPYVIVDGKQRLQAARQFVAGKIPAFGKLITEYEDEPDLLVARFFWNIAAIETRAEVLEWYLNFNDGGVVHSKEELDRVRALLAEAK